MLVFVQAGHIQVTEGWDKGELTGDRRGGRAHQSRDVMERKVKGGGGKLSSANAGILNVSEGQSFELRDG